LRVQIGCLLGVLDRRDKDAITLLFAAIPNHSFVKAKQKQKEIKDAGFQKSLPEKASVLPYRDINKLAFPASH